MRHFLLIMTLLLASCENAWKTPTGPGAMPPPTVEPPFLPPPELPRVDVPFDWRSYHGFSAFGLLAHEESTIRQTIIQAKAHGWNGPRVCSETEFWEGSYTFPIVPRDPENVRRVLDILARIPGTQVLLIGNCTLKGPVPLPQQAEWIEQVARIAAEYSNVALEVGNEPLNCSGRGWGPHCATENDVRSWIRLARDAGVQEVTADDRLCVTDNDLSFRYQGTGAYPPDFHPCRNDPRTGAPWDPNHKFMRKIASANGGVFLLSETVAYADFSGNCEGLRTCDKDRIQRYMSDCLANDGYECYPVFHSEAGLRGADYSWFPEAY